MKHPSNAHETIIAHFSRRFQVPCEVARELPIAPVIHALLRRIFNDIEAYRCLQRHSVSVIMDSMNLCEVMKLNPALVDEWECTCRYAVLSGNIPLCELWKVAEGKVSTKADLLLAPVLDAYDKAADEVIQFFAQMALLDEDTLD